MGGFKITDNKGFCISFENGNTVSVQFGYGNYCSNYDNCDMRKPDHGAESHDAECAAWGADGTWHKLGEYDDVIGGQNPTNVLALLNRMAGNPYAAEAPAMAEALREIAHSMKQAKVLGNDWKREIELTSNIVASLLARIGEA